jgi:hypothetical protein
VLWLRYKKGLQGMQLMQVYVGDYGVSIANNKQKVSTGVEPDGADISSGSKGIRKSAIYDSWGAS